MKEMRVAKCLIAVSFVAIGSFLFPAPTDYVSQAYAFISQGAAMGPGKGLDRLMATNPNNGAHGCALVVGKTNPAEAVRILLRVSGALVVFARTTSETRPDINPRDPTKHYRDMYYQNAIGEMAAARGFLQQLGTTRPDEAALLALQAATFFYNSQPGDEAYRSNYREQARNFLLGPSGSARHFADQAKDANQKKALQGQVDAQRRSWGF